MTDQHTSVAPSSSAPNPSSRAWRELFHGARGQLALGLLLMQFTTAIGVFTLSTIMPSVAAEFDGQRWYGFATSSVLLATIVTVPMAGPLMARFGLRRTMYVATPVFVLGLLGAALAPTMWAFVVGQLIRGAAGSVLGVLSLSAMVSAFAPHLRSRMIALSSSMWIVPALVGPAYAALVSSALGWRWALLILVPPMLAARALVAKRLGAYPPSVSGPQGLPLRRAGLLAIGVLCVLAASGSLAGWGAVALAVGIGLTVVALKGLFPPGTFRAQTGTPAAILAMLLLSFALYGAESIVTLMAVADLGTSLLQAGLALTAGAVCRSMASLLQPRLLEYRRFGFRRTAGLGAVLVMAGLVVLLINLLGDHSPTATVTLLWMSWAIGGFGMGLCYAPITLAAFDSSDEGQATNQATSVTLAETTGALLGMAVAGVLLRAEAEGGGLTGATSVPYILFTACMVPVILAAWRLNQRAAD
ncbi:MFS transporter [Phytoactinopolyspora limicola]|uniref:MFS transporter n=1 Tax=Phytoactinopolyspora limicola TaxID=2715536 RepID=UPI00140C5C03|nr:MFS transporter [Phytoactinopolyspora limicola]